MTRPQDCPRYDRCSANVCALDEQWHKRSHVRGDEVCFFLCESAKPDAVANFAALGAGWLLEACNHVRDDKSLPDDIARTLERAKKTGSRIAAQRAFAERQRARLAPSA